MKRFNIGRKEVIVIDKDRDYWTPAKLYGELAVMEAMLRNVRRHIETENVTELSLDIVSVLERRVKGLEEVFKTV